MRVVTRKDAERSIPPDRLEQYDRLIAGAPGVVRKGATMPYTSLNGHMFSYLREGTLVLRLPPAERVAFLERFDARLQEAYGIVQKEYVRVPEAVFADTTELAPYFRASLAYVAAMKPKPTTRRSS
jgi:hypothetical protein